MKMGGGGSLGDRGIPHQNLKLLRFGTQFLKWVQNQYQKTTTKEVGLCGDTPGFVC